MGAGSRFEPFRVRETRFLSDALAAGVVESDTRLHAALYADASAATLTDAGLDLGGVGVLRDGVLYDSDGQRREIERPLQLFTRWYGFALTFPAATIYEP